MKTNGSGGTAPHTHF